MFVVPVHDQILVPVHDQLQKGPETDPRAFFGKHLINQNICSACP
jgi:hypothetical protein